MALNPDWKEFVECLNEAKVDFVIIGAWARAFYGEPRLTGDIDFLVWPSPDNAQKILNALKAFGFVSLNLKVEDFTKPDHVVQLGFPPRRIDLLTQVTGVTVQQIWKNRVSAELDGLPVHFISREDFVVNKRATGRPKDIDDADTLDPPTK